MVGERRQKDPQASGLLLAPGSVLRRIKTDRSIRTVRLRSISAQCIFDPCTAGHANADNPLFWPSIRVARRFIADRSAAPGPNRESVGRSPAQALESVDNAEVLWDPLVIFLSLVAGVVGHSPVRLSFNTANLLAPHPAGFQHGAVSPKQKLRAVYLVVHVGNVAQSAVGPHLSRQTVYRAIHVGNSAQGALVQPLSRRPVPLAVDPRGPPQRAVAPLLNL